ncbi:hypothetical protein [Streptomyces sp. NPDC051677]|uniref:hypothetical protein n=1 Tax=Streptomyces sp. NPDC051677 TaxID=3365669 RepID=UPI0037D39AC6
MAEVTEDEVVAALGTLGVLPGRQSQALDATRTPLPPPGGSPRILSEVEWV